jgi:hypothetical protein
LLILIYLWILSSGICLKSFITTFSLVIRLFPKKTLEVEP